MKTGIVGLPRVGKTTLFSMLTGAETNLARREDRLGIAIVPDRRLDRLAELYHPRKLTHATIELVEIGSLTKESLRDGSGIAALRPVDALVQVIGVFSEAAAGNRLAPADEVRDLEFDMIVSDLGQVEKRAERVAADLKKQRSAALLEEATLLERMQAHLEREQPLRTMPLTPDEERRTRGFQFLSLKPMLYVLNLPESEASELDAAPQRHGLGAWLERPHAAATAVCAKVEAEIALLSPQEAADFLQGYGLNETGLARLARAIYHLLGLISFLTAGEDECRAWTISSGTRAVDAAAAIHSDLSRHFIRAEVIRWNELLELGSEAAARAKGKLRLEGKDYIVQDGDVMHIRHSA